MLLLDTHVLVWLLQDDARLGRRTARLIEGGRNDDHVAVSALAFWEIAWLVARNRLALGMPTDRWRLTVLGLGITELPLTGDIGVAAADLPDLHSDPADRLLVATAQAMDADFVTADERILDWPGRLKRHDARK